jgi:hypothetical protein
VDWLYNKEQKKITDLGLLAGTSLTLREGSSGNFLTLWRLSLRKEEISKCDH